MPASGPRTGDTGPREEALVEHVLAQLADPGSGYGELLDELCRPRPTRTAPTPRAWRCELMPTTVGQRTRTLLQAAADGNLLDINGQIFHRAGWESDIPATSADTRIIRGLLQAGALGQHPTGQRRMGGGRLMATNIEWTRGDDGSSGTTWNPVTGCDRVSRGCDNCYALTMAKRLKGMGSAKYQKDGDARTSGPGFGLTVHHDALRLPLTWRKPRRVFVNSMSDLFHTDVPDEFIARVWAAMAATPQHTYQILSKRHGRMLSLLTSPSFRTEVNGRYGWLIDPDGMDLVPDRPWPLSNVHLGVSVEDQKHADLRITALLDTPAAIRFLSCEPLIGPVDLSRWLGTVDFSDCWHEHSTYTECARCIQPDWVIAGGESGPGARPCDREWIRFLVKQCTGFNVPVFVKQLGSVWARENGWGGKGGVSEQWPDDLRIRQFPTEVAS